MLEPDHKFQMSAEYPQLFFLSIFCQHLAPTGQVNYKAKGNRLFALPPHPRRELC